MALKKSALCVAYVVLLLTTEFWHLNFFGGSLRPYHFATLLALGAIWPGIRVLGASSVFWALTTFFIASVGSSVLADNVSHAMFSDGLLAINGMIALVIAVLVAHSMINARSVIKTVAIITVVSVAFGVTQLSVFKQTGLSLALSSSQHNQLVKGFSSGFKTEANTFAKFLAVAFLLTLPMLLRTRRLALAFCFVVVFILGMLTSLTRSAIWGLCLALLVVWLYEIIRWRRRVAAARVALWTAIAAIGATLFAGVVGRFSEYASTKLGVLVNLHASMQGSSAATRLNWVHATWDTFMASGKTVLVGNGWGQVYINAANGLKQVTGSELLMVLGYTGVLGGVLYLVCFAVAVSAMDHVIAVSLSPARVLAARGTLYALVGIFITSQIATEMIQPMYWIVFGLAIGIQVRERTCVRANQIIVEGV